MIEGNRCEVEDARENRLHRRYDQTTENHHSINCSRRIPLPMHDELRQSTRPFVAESAVNKQETAHVRELGDREIRRQGGLFSCKE